MQEQAAKLQEQTDQLKNWNRSLEERVEKQLGEIERIRRLERFLAPQVAQLIASSDGHEGLLDSHRREVTVVFCDLRGFTAFTETTEPEEAMNVLREYHAALGELIFRYEGTLDRYAGDGVMILFNAPIQFADHTKRAVKMAVEMRDTIGALTESWRNRGHSLGFGIGIALGYATLGQIGFEQRLEYAAIGSVTNLASRLCDEAKAGQIVVSRRVFGMVETVGRGPADRRPAPEGLQSSGAGGGDFELARRGRQCGGGDGLAEAKEEVTSLRRPGQAKREPGPLATVGYCWATPGPQRFLTTNIRGYGSLLSQGRQRACCTTSVRSGGELPHLSSGPSHDRTRFATDATKVGQLAETRAPPTRSPGVSPMSSRIASFALAIALVAGESISAAQAGNGSINLGGSRMNNSSRHPVAAGRQAKPPMIDAKIKLNCYHSREPNELGVYVHRTHCG